MILRQKTGLTLVAAGGIVCWNWSGVKVGGIPGVTMKCFEIWRNTGGEGGSPDLTDVEARRHRDQTGLDTPVVYAAKDVCRVVTVSATQANALSTPPEEYDRKVET